MTPSGSCGQSGAGARQADDMLTQARSALIQAGWPRVRRLLDERKDSDYAGARDGLDQLGADRDRGLPGARQVGARGDIPSAGRAGPHRPDPLDPPIQILAQTARPATVRSLDAIHLGTALHARQTLTSFVTYKKRLLDAVTGAGHPADSPV